MLRKFSRRNAVGLSLYSLHDVEARGTIILHDAQFMRIIYNKQKCTIFNQALSISAISCVLQLVWLTNKLSTILYTTDNLIS